MSTAIRDQTSAFLAGFWDLVPLAALAPRPLLIANGALDGRNPLGGVGQAVARAAKVYESRDKSGGGNLEYFLDEGAGHEYTPVLEEKVDSWLDKWLLKK